MLLCTPVCRCIGQLCSVLLECLPTFWHAAGSSRLHNPPDMPAGMRDMLTQGLVNATAIAEQLVQDYCKKVLQAVAVVAAMGPMQTAMLMIVQVGIQDSRMVLLDAET